MLTSARFNCTISADYGVRGNDDLCKTDMLLHIDGQAAWSKEAGEGGRLLGYYAAEMSVEQQQVFFKAS